MLLIKKNKKNLNSSPSIDAGKEFRSVKNGNDLEKLLEVTGNFIWEIDPNGVFTSCSSYVKELLGFRPEEIIGKTFLDIMLEEDRENSIKWFEEITKSCTQFKLYKTRNKNLTGEVVIMENSGIPIFDFTGKLSGYEGISRNITEQIQTEEALRESQHKTQKSLMSMVNVLASTVERRDPYTAGHQQRVARLAMAIAKEMDLPFKRLDIIYKAGTLHDIGKICIPAEILSKPSKLTDDEFSLIKVHPQTGFEILKETEFPPDVALIALQHHERMNGTGYPQGLSGNEILLEARIIAVADVVESMASHRPYRPSLGIDKALEEISSNAGPLYDKQVVDTCLKVFKEKKFEFV